MPPSWASNWPVLPGKLAVGASPTSAALILETLGPGP